MPTPLQQVPGLGKSLAAQLASIGFCHLEELAGRDPETVFVHLHLANYVAQRSTPQKVLTQLRRLCQKARKVQAC